MNQDPNHISKPQEPELIAPAGQLLRTGHGDVVGFSDPVDGFNHDLDVGLEAILTGGTTEDVIALNALSRDLAMKGPEHRQPPARLPSTAAALGRLVPAMLRRSTAVVTPADRLPLPKPQFVEIKKRPITKAADAISRIIPRKQSK
jgi:hypothetical protein